MKEICRSDAAAQHSKRETLISSRGAGRRGRPRNGKEEREIELPLFMGLFIRDEMWRAQEHEGR